MICAPCSSAWPTSRLPRPARSGPDTSTKASTAWHHPGAAGPQEPVSDCYALNAAGTCTWACYDPGFAIIRISDGTLTRWHNDIHGVRALAAAGTRAALFGGYGPDHDRLALTDLRDGQAYLTGEYRVVLPGGHPLPPGTQVTGRGPRLHLLTDNSWYQLDLADTPR